ncbi:MAG: pyridoxal phosphate-dependent aminotransferase [Fretibacterium sp.]|nr:pyridoxal phosphate-dependent aminotransferase [Fretibacterium sp.]
MKDAMAPGGIREIATRAQELEALGRNIVHLEIGRPDYDSPLSAKKAAFEALSQGRVHYTENAGVPELRHAIAGDRKRTYGQDVDGDSEVIVTAGATEALTTSFLTLLEPGDEVLIPTPFFPAYSVQVALAGGVVREVPCHFEEGFQLNPERLKAAVTPRTKMILVNSPNNPTGVVLSRSELQAVADLAQRHDLWVISDECYEKFLYGGKPLSLSCLEGMRDRTIVVSAASKTFSMTGWRVGWLILPSRLKPYANKCHQHLTTCVTSFAQYGVAEALRSAETDVRRMIEGYRERRDVFLEALSRVEGFEIYPPAGAFYVFASVERLTSRLNRTTLELASWLLEEAGVATVPGDPFRASGDFLRLAFCRPVEELRTAAARLETATRGLLENGSL